jgi:hypothetical protein
MAIADPSAQLVVPGVPSTSPVSPTNPRKRSRAPSGQPAPIAPAIAPLPSAAQYGDAPGSAKVELSTDTQGQPATKKGRTNTPWTPAEEQRLKQMRDQGKSWSEIAKTFPNRTEGRVKKHWYKVSHARAHVPTLVPYLERISNVYRRTGMAICSQKGNVSLERSILFCL